MLDLVVWRGVDGGGARVRGSERLNTTATFLFLGFFYFLADVGVSCRGALWRKMGAKKGVQLALLQAAYFDLGGGFVKGFGDLGANSCESGTGRFSSPRYHLTLPCSGQFFVPSKRWGSARGMGASQENCHDCSARLLGKRCLFEGFGTCGC